MLLLASALALGTAACNSNKTSGDVVAKVNGKSITRSELDRNYKAQLAGAQGEPPKEQAESVKLNLLRDMIETEIIMQKADKLGLIATDDEVNRKIQEEKAPFTAEQFQERLKQQGFDEDYFKKLIVRNLTREKVYNKEIGSKVNVSDTDVTEYYNAHKAEFNFVEPQYELARIVVTPGNNPPARNSSGDDARTDAEAKNKIRMLINRLNSGEDFAQVAMKYSEDPQTAQSGGYLGVAPESSLQNTDPGTREALKKMRPGQISDPITVNDQQSHQAYYQIVKLIAKEPAGQRDISDPRVQQFIRDQIRSRREQLLLSAFLANAWAEAEVKNYYAQEILANAGK